MEQGTYGAGVTAAIAVVFLIMTIITWMEFYLELTHRKSIGHRVRQWATISPLLGAILLGVLCAFLGHFFGHEIVFRT